MSPEAYQTMQEASKKIYELVTSAEEKEACLLKMIEAERIFMQGQARPLEASATVLGKPVTLKIDPKTRRNAVSSSEPELLSMAYDKITPANLFDHIANVRASSGDGDAFMKKLKSSPELQQALCDALNGFLKLKLQEELKNQPGMEIFENESEIGFRKNPQSIQNPEAEVNDIVERARNFSSQARMPAMEKLDDNSHEDSALLRRSLVG